MKINGIDIQEGCLYYIGVTHHPHLVLVSHIVEPDKPLVLGGHGTNAPGIVEFETVPIDTAEPQRMMASIFASMVKSGTKTQIQRLLANDTQDAQMRKSQLQAVLEGRQPGQASTRIAQSRLIVYVAPRSGSSVGDLWRTIDAATGGCCNGLQRGAGPQGRDLYECTAFGDAHARELTQHPDFEVVQVMWGKDDITDQILSTGSIQAARQGNAEVPGFGWPDFPADLETFKERLAYQRGIHDARLIAREQQALDDPSGPHFRCMLPDGSHQYVSTARIEHECNAYPNLSHEAVVNIILGRPTGAPIEVQSTTCYDRSGNQIGLAPRQPASERPRG